MEYNQDSEMQFKRIFEEAADAILIAEIDSGIIRYANQAASRLLLLPIERIIGLHNSDIHPKHGVDSFERDIQETATLGTSHPIQNKILRSDGKEVPVEIRASRIMFESKQCLMGTFRDISDRLNSEEAVLGSQITYRTLIENSHNVIFCVDENGYYKFVNKVFASTFNKEPEYFYGKSFWDVYSQELADQRYVACKETFQTGEKGNIEVVVPRPNKTHYYYATLNPIRDEAGKVILVLVDSSDITERKEMELELQKYSEELKELNRTKDRFFSIIAHDLRSPFQGLMSMTSFMAEDAGSLSSADLTRIGKALHSRATNLFKLLKNLLDWSLMQQGKMNFTPVNLNLAEVISVNIDLVSKRCEEKRINIVQIVSEFLEVSADEAMLDSIFSNLLSNAIKFTKSSGNIIIRAKDADENMIEVCISDSGIGMPPSLLSKIFSLEESVGRKGTDGEESTGLGLLLCKEFVEKHSGRIWVESEEDFGTVFFFTLPKSQ